MLENPDKITVYATEWCPDCKRAKFFFKRKKIEINWINVDQNKEASDYVVKLNNGNRSVPTIIFPDGTVLVEPDTRALESKLEEYLP